MIRKVIKNSFFIGILFLNSWITIAIAQEDLFPKRPIKLIIGSGPGSSTDIPNRTLAKAAEKYLGQPIVCINTPGGAGTRALGTQIKEKPDGYTLCTTSQSVVAAVHAEKLSFTISKDFIPIIQTYKVALAFAVRKDAPWNTWQEFIKYARENKGKVTIGTWGARSFPWLLTREIEKKEDLKFVYVPFAGPGEVMAALLGGHITANTLGSAVTYAKSGECKLLLSFTDRRLKIAPGAPTSKELYGIEESSCTGIVAPKGLSGKRLMILHEAFKKALADPSFMEVADKFDLQSNYKSSDDFRKSIEKAERDVRTLD